MHIIRENLNIEMSGDAEKSNDDREPDKDSLMEELTAQGLYKSLSTISLDSLNSKLDQKNGARAPKAKESYVLDLDGTIKGEEKNYEK